MIPLIPDAPVADAATGPKMQGRSFPFSGGVVSNTAVGQDFDIMNPYLAMKLSQFMGVRNNGLSN